MYLYYLDVTMSPDTPLAVVVVAESDEKAFEYAELEVEKQFLGGYTIEEMAVIQRKNAAAAQGYVLRTVSSE